jgi:hypothetical protein
MWLLLTGLMLLNPVRGHSATYSSTAARNTLLELYTSEGCSSCPPAERWFSELKYDPRLWQTLFPVAFHVDYWDDLGWKDTYSDARYSRRQRHYAANGYAGTVYTPGFFRNGREWRGFFNRRDVEPGDAIEVGKLSATVTPLQIDVTFKPAADINATRLNIAILGFGKTTRIRAGENAGRVLRHDFVVLAHQRYSGSNNRWQITDRALLGRLEKGGAVVVWLTQGDNPTPVQVAGGWIEK